MLKCWNDTRWTTGSVGKDKDHKNGNYKALKNLYYVCTHMYVYLNVIKRLFKTKIIKTHCGAYRIHRNKI